MKVLVNGTEHDLDAQTSVASLLIANGYENRAVAVEINREIVPRSMHGQRLVRDGDRIEIVHAIGGG